MKKVITTVGTSVFDNYFNQNNNSSFQLYYNKLENKSFSEWSDYKEYIDKLKQGIKGWIKGAKDASAEITSILKIREELQGEELDVYLLATDTILSALAAEIIKDYFEDKVNAYFNNQNDIISELQVKDKSSFIKKGLPNLINRINQISAGFWENILFNITGGYKGVIPYLTIISTINRCEIKYIFEKSEELITIPQLPIKIDETIFDNYINYINKLEQGIDDYNKEKQNNKTYKELEKNGLVEYEDNLAFLSPIGQILYTKYKNNVFVFYASDNVFEEIQKQGNIREILSSKFVKNFERKTEQKNDHYVYDDGNNPYRIFYFQQENNIYIYKTFEDHDEYEKYLSSEKITDEFKQEYIQKSKIRKIKISGRN